MRLNALLFPMNNNRYIVLRFDPFLMRYKPFGRSCCLSLAKELRSAWLHRGFSAFILPYYAYAQRS